MLNDVFFNPYFIQISTITQDLSFEVKYCRGNQQQGRKIGNFLRTWLSKNSQ